MKTLLAVLLGFCVVSRVFAAVDAPTNPPVIAEITIQPTGSLSRISVHLVNQSKAPQTLFVGRVGTHSAGRFYPVDLDRVAINPPSGNGLLVVPELIFGAIQFSAPTTVRWGATIRNMRPTTLELPADARRVFYCVFSVPSFYVQGEFTSGTMKFPVLPATNQAATILEVPVTKCLRPE